MKYFLFSMIILLVVFTGCAVLSSGRGQEEAEADGEILEGMGQGYRGPIFVQVRLRGDAILDVSVVDSEEDRFIGEAAIEELIDMVIEYNTTDIDAVTGATESSRGFLEAVDNAIMMK